MRDSRGKSSADGFTGLSLGVELQPSNRNRKIKREDPANGGRGVEKRRDRWHVVALWGGRTFSSSDGSKSAGDGGLSLLYSPTVSPRSLSSFNIMIVVI